MTAEKWDDVKKFAFNNWPEALAATLTISGAAAFLLIRYYRQKKLSDQTLKELAVLEQETQVGNQEAPVFLETGASVIKKLPGSENTAKIMATSIPDPAGQEVMNALGEMGNYSFKRRE